MVGSSANSGSENIVANLRMLPHTRCAIHPETRSNPCLTCRDRLIAADQIEKVAQIAVAYDDGQIQDHEVGPKLMEIFGLVL